MLESWWRAELLAAYEDGRLDQVYERLTLSDQEVARGVEDGWLVEDTDFRDYLAACPDPLQGGELAGGLACLVRGTAAATSSPSSRPTPCTR